jgi:hypothetical protein
MIVSAPLLVLSAPGAEAARLAAMLGRHPAAYGLPELNLHLAPTVEGLLSVFQVTQGNAQDGLLRVVAELYCGGQGDADIDAAREWLKRRADWSSMELLNELGERIAPKLPVLAESSLAWRLLDVEAWLARVPDARVLQVVRHPRTQCAELASRLQGPLFVPPDYKDYGVDPAVIDPQLAWYRINRNIGQSLGALPAAQRRQVQAEDLFAAPEDTLRELCGWLGLPFGEAALYRMMHAEDGPYARIGSTAAPYGMELEFHEAPQFSGRLRPRLGLEGPAEWRRDGKALAAEVVTLARSYGYR